MTEKITDVQAVEVGQYYLVPTVMGRWSGYAARSWPVIGPKHNDRHCLNFDWDHYHLDARFFPFAYPDSDHQAWKGVMSMPLMTSERMNPAGLPAVVWKRLKCRRTRNPVQDMLVEAVSTAKQWQCLVDDFAGRQALNDGRGWVCPHRKVPLAGQPVEDGVIVCPLHLLRIDAATGKVLGSATPYRGGVAT